MQKKLDCGKSDFFLGWKKITSKDNFKQFYILIHIAEYFNSIVYAQYFNMYYKIVDNVLFFVKPSFNFNTYSIISYTTPILLDNTISINDGKLLDNGISLRGAYDIGQIDKFGREYIYDCDEFVAMRGSDYLKHRNRLKSYLSNQNEYDIVYGFNEDIPLIIDNWSKLKSNNTQKKLWGYIVENKNICTITTTYYRGVAIGFSVVENINDRNGIIIQRLINYANNYSGEANFILHYNDCVYNKGKILNIGASRTNEIKISKEKLKPKIFLNIKRIKSKVKINKLDYKKLKRWE